jgi:hypothetical protein
MKARFTLLSFDVEEFDVPLEYGQAIDLATQLSVSLQGVEAVIDLLDRLEIQATFFVTANFAQHYPDLIRHLAQRHEIASHGFYHSAFETADLEKSRLALEEILDRPIVGFRMARLQAVEEQAIAAAGYRYNSSLNPTYLPGRYNNFSEPRRPFLSDALLNIPVSVTPLIRFPLFWLSFKHLPLPLYKMASTWTLGCDRLLSLYFHPWEFTNISHFGLPPLIHRRSGREMRDRLENYLIWLRQRSKFVTYAAYAEMFLQSELSSETLFYKSKEN